MYSCIRCMFGIQIVSSGPYNIYVQLCIHVSNTSTFRWVRIYCKVTSLTLKTSDFRTRSDPCPNSTNLIRCVVRKLLGDLEAQAPTEVALSEFHEIPLQ